MIRSLRLVALAGGLIAASAVGAQAASVTLLPTADGRVIINAAGTAINTTDPAVEFSRSGPSNDVRGVLEYDLSSIDDTAVINSITLDLTLTRFVSNLGTNPAEVDIFAFAGDGVVSGADYTAAATQVIDTTTEQGGMSGDLRSFSFDMGALVDVENLLAGDLMTLRLQTENFAQVFFASLEDPNLPAAALTIDFDVPVNQIPLPAGLPLLLTGLGALGLAASRRRG